MRSERRANRGPRVRCAHLQPSSAFPPTVLPLRPALDRAVVREEAVVAVVGARDGPKVEAVRRVVADYRARCERISTGVRGGTRRGPGRADKSANSQEAVSTTAGA